MNPTRLAKMITSEKVSVLELSQEYSILLVFLRHFGCLFCREALHDLANIKDELQQEGIKIVLVHMSEPALAEEYLAKYKLTGTAYVSDPSIQWYEQFGLVKGNMKQLLGLGVWMRGAAVVAKGIFPQRVIGDGFQMPGVFVIQKGQIIQSFIHRLSSDRPDYKTLVDCCVTDAASDLDKNIHLRGLFDTKK